MNKKFSWVLSGSLTIVLCTSGCGVGFGGGSTDVANPFESENSFSKSSPQDEINIDGFLKKLDEANELADNTEDQDKDESEPGSCQDIKDLNECNESCAPTMKDGKQICDRKARDGCSDKLASECNGGTPWGGTCHLDSRFKSLCYEQKPANCGQVPQTACNGACEWSPGTGTCVAFTDPSCSPRSADDCDSGDRCVLDTRLAGGKCYWRKYQNCAKITDAVACTDSCEWDGAACNRKADATCSGKTVANCGTAAPVERCKLDERFALAQCYQGKYNQCQDILDEDKCTSFCEWDPTLADGNKCQSQANNRCRTVAGDQCEAYACRADNRFENGAKCYYDPDLFEQKKLEELKGIIKDIQEKLIPDENCVIRDKIRGFAAVSFSKAKREREHGSRHGDEWSNGLAFEMPKAWAKNNGWRQWIANNKDTDVDVQTALQNTVATTHLSEEEIIKQAAGFMRKMRAAQIFSVQGDVREVNRARDGQGIALTISDRMAVTSYERLYKRYGVLNFKKSAEAFGLLASFGIRWNANSAGNAMLDPENYALSHRGESTYTIAYRAYKRFKTIVEETLHYDNRVSGFFSHEEGLALALKGLTDFGLAKDRLRLASRDTSDENVLREISEKVDGLLASYAYQQRNYNIENNDGGLNGVNLDSPTCEHGAFNGLAYPLNGWHPDVFMVHGELVDAISNQKRKLIKNKLDDLSDIQKNQIKGLIDSGNCAELEDVNTIRDNNLHIHNQGAIFLSQLAESVRQDMYQFFYVDDEVKKIINRARVDDDIKYIVYEPVF